MPHGSRFYSAIPPHADPRIPQKTKIFAPKTRLAIGIPFVAALIYSMVRSCLTVGSNHEADWDRHTMNLPNPTDPHLPIEMLWPSANLALHLPHL